MLITQGFYKMVDVNDDLTVNVTVIPSWDPSMISMDWSSYDPILEDALATVVT